MWFGWIGHVAALLILGSPDPHADLRNDRLPEPIVTQQTVFTIPFGIPPTSDPQKLPTHVLLSLSRDYGTSWVLHSQVTPEMGQFLFQADTDGEYWFAIQTRDRTGKVSPEFTGVPGMRVRVDRVPPQMQVAAWRGEAGEVTARWRIDEPHFRPESVTVAYRYAGEPQWQQVALDSQHQSKAGDAYLGEVTWWPGQETRAIEVQVQAFDAAANCSRTATRVELPAAGALAEVGALAEKGIPAISGNEPPTVSSDSSQPVAVQPFPAVAKPYLPALAADSGAAQSGAPHPEQVRAVNSRLFELEFEAAPADLAGISHAELWGTRDGGRTWQSMSLHERGRSPILAKVDREGLYGFRVVLHGKTAAGPPPQTGDLPDIWIRVDLTPPVARIVSIQPGSGPEANHLVIGWTASDDALADAPVRLTYSTQRGGPWRTIAAPLPDTGRYAWPLPGNVTEPVYIRLEAWDAAGNVAEFETSEPVESQRNDGPPKVFIRDVRPLGDASQRPGPRRYIFR